MKTLSKRFQQLADLSMAVCLAVMASAVFVNVVLRYGFGDGIAASEELSRLLFVWMVFIGATAAYPKGELMAFTMLLGALGRRPGAQSALIALIRLLVILACSLVAWGAWQQVAIGWDSHSVVLKYPTALLPLPALLCSATIGMMALFELLTNKPLLPAHAVEAE